MKQFLLCISTLFFALLCSAQENRVVKDNINCTYGIKNSNGNWIVEPNYILIEQYNTGYFLVRDVEGLGVFSPDGKQIITCKYRSLSPINRTWHIKHPNQFVQVNEVEPYVFFLGAKDTSKCIINSVGQEIGSFPLDSRIEFDGDKHILVRDKVSRRSSYLDTTGNVMLDNLSGQLQPFGQRNYTLIGNYPQSIYSARGDVRLIDRSGKLLLNQVMDHALIDTSGRIFFEVNGKYGAMMISGDTIIAPKYRRKDGVLSLDRKAVWVIFDDENRAGIMKNDGTVIIEPIYDQVHPIVGRNRSQIAWMIENEGYFGVLNFEGKEIIPTNFDRIYPVHFASENQREVLTNYIGRKNNQSFYLDVIREILNSDGYDSILSVSDYSYSYSQSMTSGLITKRDGKYGVLNPDGAKKTACIYDTLLQNPTVNQYFFRREKDVIEYNFSVNRITSTDWLPYASDDSFHIYTNNINYLSVIKSSEDGRVIRFDPNYSYFYQQGNLLIGQHLGSKKWTFFNKNSKKKLPLENIVTFNSRGRNRFLIATSSNHYGIIDIDGALIIDTVYSSINLNQRSSMIWATKIIENRFVYELLDSIGRKVLPNLLDNSFELDTGDQIASQNQKKGVIDSKSFSWKIRPEHFCLLKLFGDYYYAGNELNKKGILHADGRIIVPIIYDTIILLYTNCHINGNCLDNVQPEALWLLRKGDTEFLADQDGKLINSKSTIRTYKSTLLFDDDSLFATSNLYPSYPVLDYSPSLHFFKRTNDKTNPR